jgi:hypothetical protein
MTLDLADVIAADREEQFLAGLSRAALAVYHELVSVRDRFGYVAADRARAAVRAALETYYVAIDHQVEMLAGRVAAGGAVEPAVENAAKARAKQVAGTARVLAELDARGLVIVGVVPGSAWRVWTADDAAEAAEVFG